LFFRDGRVFGLSRVLRSPRIPLGISVEETGLEIVGLESRSGADNGRFQPMGGPRRKTGLAGTGERGMLGVS